MHFGESYAQTLSHWRNRFDAHAQRIDQLGFDDTFAECRTSGLQVEGQIS